MFGYVLPLPDRLSEQARAQYRAVYCGLCDCLRRRYGFRARFLVNYDMTFLYLLLRRDASVPYARSAKNVASGRMPSWNTPPTSVCC